MNQTSNYQLNQWDPEDRILRTDFNEDNAKLDAALKANASAISSEASTRSSAVNALTNKLNKKGNCRVEIMTYVGTGTSGSENPSSLTFSARPVLFFIGGDGGGVGYNVRGNDKLYVRPGNSAYTCSGSWSGNTYSWYNSEIRYQLNESGTTYTVVAFFDCDE